MAKMTLRQQIKIFPKITSLCESCMRKTLVVKI